MAYGFVYTKEGEDFYNGINNAMHLAISRDGREFIPMRNNTGILFPKAEYDEENPKGITKTLRYPWVFRLEDGSFGVCAVRFNEWSYDNVYRGAIVIYTSKDLIRYEEPVFLSVASDEIMNPKCRWEEAKKAYYLEWECGEKLYCGYTRYFKEAGQVQLCEKSLFNKCDSCGIEDAVPGNIIEITREEADKIEKYLGAIFHIDTEISQLEVAEGVKISTDSLPKAKCIYNDGSTHMKKVVWNQEDYEKIDFSKAGAYKLRGRIYQTKYPFPLMEKDISDPNMVYYNGKYYMSGSGRRSVTFRISDTMEGVFTANPVEVYKMPDSDVDHDNMWAPELHIIDGIPYILTTVGQKQWHTVRCHILRCKGDPGNPKDWEEPKLVLRPDGRELNEKGISLDMTYFCVEGVHYVMWSNRDIYPLENQEVMAEPADIYIATVDPQEPWQLTTNPVCICRPIYGWDRLETEVDEGPYLLERNDDLFVTISGSSTGMADLYCLGLLHSKKGKNLLSPDGWDWLPYPVLTKESVENQYGPGHNNFIKDLDTGDDIMVYHAVPHDKDGKSLGRHVGMRRVHWAANGYPYFEMTEEMDLNPKLTEVELTINIVKREVS